MQLGSLYIDIATNEKTGLSPAIKMVGSGRCVYGADCGLPCSTEATMEENRRDVLGVEREVGLSEGSVGMNGWGLFPRAAERIERGIQ